MLQRGSKQKKIINVTIFCINVVKTDDTPRDIQDLVRPTFFGFAFNEDKKLEVVRLRHTCFGFIFS